MTRNEAKAEADKLTAMGYNAYPSVCIVGKTPDEDVYFVQMNGWLPDNRTSHNRTSHKPNPITEPYMSVELDDFVF